jgi:PAS domain S-box-containing protein
LSASSKHPPDLAAGEGLFALSHDLLCVIDSGGRLARVNPAFERALGWTPDELVGRSIPDLVHPEDRAATEAALQAIVAGSAPETVENRYRCRDGSYRWLSWRASPPDEQGCVYAIGRDVTDRRAREAQLGFQAMLLDAVGQAVIATDLDGVVTYWGSHAETLYGWRADEALGRNVMEVTPTRASKEQAAAIMASLREGRSWSGEFPVRRRDGTEFIAHITDTPVVDAAGAVAGIIGVSVDVTESRRMADALRASEMRFRTLLGHASDAILVGDGDERILVANDAAHRLLGYDADELLRLRVDDLVPEEDRASKPARLNELRAGEPRLTERRLRRRDGSAVPVEISSTRLADGTFQSIIRDITERRAAEAALRASEERYRTLVETSHEGICAVDAVGRITYANWRLGDMLGYAVSELVGRQVFELAEPAAAFAARTRFARRQLGISEAYEVPLLRKDGATIWALESASTLRDAGGGFAGAIYLLGDITDRVAAQRRLESSERLFRALTEQASEFVAVLDADGTIRYANPAYHHRLGYAPGETLGQSAFRFGHPDDMPAVAETFRALIRHPGAITTAEYRAHEKNGAWRILSTVAQNLLADPAVGGIVINAHDVTERRQAENALRESEARYERIAASVPGMIYQVVLDQDGTVTLPFVSEGARDLYRREPEALQRDPRWLARAVHPDDQAEWRRSVAESAETLSPWEWLGRIVLPDGEEKWIEGAARPERQATGRIVWNGVLLDVTARRRAEELGRRQTEMLQTIFDHIPAMVTLADPEGRPEFANREWKRVSGWTDEEVGSLSLFTELYPDPAERARVAAFMRDADGRPGDFRIRVRDGRVIETVWTSVRLSDGSVLGMGQDVTERRRLESALRQSQKMEAIGRLAGGVAHDFNNLLQVITANTLFARERLPEESPVQSDLAEIDTAADRAAALTRQLLAFSRRQVLNPARLNVNRVVTTVERMLRRLIGADVTLVTDLQPDLSLVYADAGQLEQVLMNLAVNARDAMPEGGTLAIETQEVRVDAADAAGLAPGAYVALRVRDTGVGMDEATQAQMFEPFFTTKEAGRGTGLGLATVYGIVAQSGGQVLVESEPGAGSTFTVLLPNVDGSVDAAASRPAERTPRGGETILVVEDEAAVRDAVRRMLQRGGYTVLEARHGVDALQLLADPAVQVDLVLSDVVMPEMGASALLARLDERNAPVKLLLMSGYSAEAVARQSGITHDFAVLTKPFTSDELLRRVRALLDAPSGA